MKRFLISMVTLISFGIMGKSAYAEVVNFKCKNVRVDEVMYFSLDTDTGRFFDDGGDNIILTHLSEDPVAWKNVQTDKTTLVSFQGNSASVHFNYDTDLKYDFFCHKESAK